MLCICNVSSVCSLLHSPHLFKFASFLSRIYHFLFADQHLYSSAGGKFLCWSFIFAVTWATRAKALVHVLCNLLFDRIRVCEEKCIGNEGKITSGNWACTSSSLMKVCLLRCLYTIHYNCNINLGTGSDKDTLHQTNLLLHISRVMTFAFSYLQLWLLVFLPQKMLLTNLTWALHKMSTLQLIHHSWFIEAPFLSHIAQSLQCVVLSVRHLWPEVLMKF